MTTYIYGVLQAHEYGEEMQNEKGKSHNLKFNFMVPSNLGASGRIIIVAGFQLDATSPGYLDVFDCIDDYLCLYLQKCTARP